jgi:hypothetical protein
MPSIDMVAAMRKTVFISVKHLAEKELLRYELMMPIANEKTVFRWLPSDSRVASVALLDPSVFNPLETLPANCICIWVAASPDHPAGKGDMTLPAKFRLSDLINVLDRAALRILDMKTGTSGMGDASDPLSQRTYRISRWISLEHDFSAVNFQKILAVMTKQSVDWRWLLVYGGLSERDAYLFLDELRKKEVLVERSKLPAAQEPAQQFHPEQKESGVGLFVKKINQWLGRTRSQELETTR